MSQEDDGYEVYAIPIKFEGEITIPCSDSKYAEMEVRKAINHMIEPYRVWGDHRDPSYSVWWDSTLYERRVRKEQKNEVYYRNRRQTTSKRR